MIRTRMAAAWIVLLLALAAGTAADAPRPHAARQIGPYHVLAADFHVHSHPFSWSTLSPFDTVIDARHHGLDVVVLTPHNHLWVAQAGEWFSRLLDRPLVIVGEEVTAPGYHLIGVGLSETVSNQLTAKAAIDEIHRQGGVAIAAHPFENGPRGYDAAARAALDGSELIRPDSLRNESGREKLRAFLAQTDVVPVGSTDYHGLGPVGYSRTYVFARERTASGVVDAIRDGRTVVYDEQQAHGDPEMIRLAEDAGGLPRDVPRSPRPDVLAMFSRIAAIIALAAMVLFNRMQ